MDESNVSCLISVASGPMIDKKSACSISTNRIARTRSNSKFESLSFLLVVIALMWWISSRQGLEEGGGDVAGQEGADAGYGNLEAALVGDAADDAFGAG